MSESEVAKQGLQFERVFSDPRVKPFDQVNWVKRTAEIKDSKGGCVFKQEDVEFPEFYSQLAVNIVASKYFYGDGAAGNGSPADGKREYSLRQLVGRVADTISGWGVADGYFDAANGAVFREELAWLLLNQHGAFNSPVWFNVGLWEKYGVEGDYDGYYYDADAGVPKPVPSGEAYKHPQGSACFLIGVEDSIPAIYERSATEGRIFKYGSGCGSNNSRIRSRYEFVSGGGRPSGPVSFMSVYDAVAKVTKSAGKTRRAAKLERLDAWHPDILEFIRVKGKEEAKAHALIREGYEANFNGEAYSTVCFQNSNMSVGFSDAFMAKVTGDDPDPAWQTLAVTTGTPYNTGGERMPRYDANFLFDEVASGTWRCGDPGVHFDDTINRWHTCKATGPIRTSNPCCFVHDTLVETSIGLVPIGRLAGMADAGESLPLAMSYSASDDGLTPRQIRNAWKVGATRELVDVATSSGAILRCTPEHGFALRDGGFAPASGLPRGAALVGFNAPVHVTSVTPIKLDEPVDVFNIDVADHHNFVVTSGTAQAGVVVANSEFVFLDGTSCNLASLNLLKFLRADGTFDLKAFRAAVIIFLTAQEILVDRAGYPTAQICQNSRDFRPLGLGYCNLGALLMARGVPYDSDAGRDLAAAITAIMDAQAHLTSSSLAYVKGPFPGYAANRAHYLDVMRMHSAAAQRLRPCDGLDDAAAAAWRQVVEMTTRYGARNAQTSLLAPTGTIAFMMDADTTGIEPDIALVKYKVLAGGGNLKYVNQSVRRALVNLGYKPEPVHMIDGDPDSGEIVGDHLQAALDWVEAHGSLEDFPLAAEKDLSVFDCAFPVKEGGRSIRWQGHVDMMAAVQPFLSGSISKTVNMPESSTVEDVRNAYIYAWKKGLKCVAIYRDNSKMSQPLSTKAEKTNDAAEESAGDHKPVPAGSVDVVAVDVRSDGAAQPPGAAVAVSVSERDPAGSACTPCRLRLPDTRHSLTHKFSVGGHEGYVTAGLYPDGRPGELFVTMAKEGSTVGGMMDVFGTAISIGLQYGVPLRVFVDKFAHTRFEPSGFTKNADVPLATSVADYIVRWLGMEFIDGYRRENSPSWSPDEEDPGESTVVVVAEPPEAVSEVSTAKPAPAHGKPQLDAPICGACGCLTVRAGACYVCKNCGTSSGCG